MASSSNTKRPDFGSTPWEEGEDVVTINGAPIGMTVSRAQANVVVSWLERAGWNDIVRERDAEIARLTEQRDALLAACARVVNMLGPMESDPRLGGRTHGRIVESGEVLRAAIEKARGGDHA